MLNTKIAKSLINEYDKIFFVNDNFDNSFQLVKFLLVELNFFQYLHVGLWLKITFSLSDSVYSEGLQSVIHYK